MSQFDAVRRQDALYKQIEHTEAWKDYQHRLVVLRDATKLALERGTLDKWGRTHDEEQRSALYLIERLIAYVPQIHADYATLLKEQEQLAANAGRAIYGSDSMMDNF